MILKLNSKCISALVMLFASACAVAGVYEDMIEAVKTDQVTVMKKLVSRGFDVNTTDVEGNTLLMMAAKEGSGGAVSLLLSAKARIDGRNQFGETALMLASIQGRLEIVRTLLQGGAEFNHQGWTPLMYAATNGHANTVRLLISYGAQVNARADNGFTALMMAAREGHEAVVALLLASGADRTLKSDAGGTAVSLARERKHMGVTRLLEPGGSKSP